MSDNAFFTRFTRTQFKIHGVDSIARMEYRRSALNSRPEKMQPLSAAVIDFNEDQCVSDSKDRYDLILSLHCRRIRPADFVSSASCVNVHSGFNQYNRDANEYERNAAIQKIEVLTGQLQAIKTVCGAAVAHRDSAAAHREAAIAEQDQARSERDPVQSEHDSVSTSLNAVHIELNSTKLAPDAAAMELDSVKIGLDSVFSSHSWRLIKLCRDLKRTMTHHQYIFK